MQKYMNEALVEAGLAFDSGETPVGAVIVKDGQIIARAHNESEKNKDLTCHAELNAIKKACAVLECARLADCELYVTKEPCPMCMGAIINSRIGILVYGCPDFNFGFAGGYADLSLHPYAKKTKVYGGIMEDECAKLLKSFYEKVRSDIN